MPETIRSVFLDPDGMKWKDAILAAETGQRLSYTSTSDPDDIEAFIRELQQNEGGADQDDPPRNQPSWLTKLRNFQTASSNWATNGPSKWADEQSAVVTEMGQAFTTVTQGYRDYMDETAKPLYEIYGHMAMLGGNATGWGRGMFNGAAKTVGHLTPWSSMTKAEMRAFQRSYSRHAREL